MAGERVLMLMMGRCAATCSVALRALAAASNGCEHINSDPRHDNTAEGRGWVAVEGTDLVTGASGHRRGGRRGALDLARGDACSRSPALWRIYPLGDWVIPYPPPDPFPPHWVLIPCNAAFDWKDGGQGGGTDGFTGIGLTSELH